MITAPKIKHILASVLLTAALLFPTVVQAIHTFDGHEHVSCKELKTHLHEEKVQCDLCDFQLSSFQFTFFSYELNVHETVVEQPKISVHKVYFLYKSDFTSLRGPPLS